MAQVLCQKRSPDGPGRICPDQRTDWLHATSHLAVFDELLQDLRPDPLPLCSFSHIGRDLHALLRSGLVHLRDRRRISCG